MNKKERFIKAHFELAKKHLWPDGHAGCPLCRVAKHSYELCTQGHNVNNCEMGCCNMKTYVHLGIEPSRLRARYHIEAVKILRGLDSKRFTKKGWVGFPELWELDTRLAAEK